MALISFEKILKILETILIVLQAALKSILPADEVKE